MGKSEFSEIRKDLNAKLKQEFDEIHDIITDSGSDMGKQNPERLRDLIRCQIELAAQIIREERVRSGENSYLLPPYRTE